MKTPEQVIAEELAWLSSVAEGLPPADRQAALEALAGANPPNVAISLFKLLKDGVLPQAWDPHVTDLWEFSR